MSQMTLDLKADGRGRRDTSRDAHAAMRSTGVLSTREQQVIEFLSRVDYAPTRAEIARATQMTHGACCGRVHTLIEMGLVKEMPRRVCTVTGGDAHGLKLA